MNLRDPRVPWLVGTALLVVALLGLSWAFMISPKLDERDGLDEQTEAIKIQNDILEQRVAQLKADFANIEVYEAEIANLRIHIPSNDEITAYHQLASDQLGEAGLGLERISYSAPAGLDTVPLPKSRNPSSVEPSPTPEATDDAAESSETEGQEETSVAPAEVPTELELPEGLVLIPVELTFAGPYQSAVAFIEAQQTNARIMSIATIDFTLVTDDVEDPNPGELPLILGDVEVFVTGYLWALAPLQSELPEAGEEVEDPIAGPLPAPETPRNPFFPIEGGQVGDSSGLPPRASSGAQNSSGAE